MAAMQTVLAKRWISQGWRAMANEDSEPMAEVFIEALDREKVPFQHYGELFQRSIGLRANRLAQGLKCEDFSVDLMLACWPGLKRELEQRDIDAGRTLAANAASVCDHCYGTGFRDHIVAGKILGKRKCRHED